VTVVQGSCPTITLSSLPNGKVGTLYLKYVTASPAGSYSYSAAGTVPPGLTFFGAIGLLYGYPTAANSYSFNLSATSTNSCTGSSGYTVVIVP
jgi:hypothetical protein